ncbi:MAG: SDR family oxidoreductase [Alphaproteobacteria bacterium]|nr:MAG: SDR family oxidoreductase [Alphaproteobacteria bacterium]
MQDMSGKVVMITGASRGIGEAAARLFAKAGASVVLLARSAERIAEIAGEIGESALAVPCDVSRAWEVEAAVDAAVSSFGGLDVLINNAGVIEPIQRLEDADPDAWGHAVDVNLKGVFHGMRAAYPAMIARGGGTIITVSSGAAHRPLEGWSHYCAAKAGAAMLTRVADLEWRSRGIRAMGLSPGTVATEMQVLSRRSGINPVSQMDPSEHIPPEWPARALVWMCSDDADEFVGMEVQLRDPAIRRRVGLEP